MPTFGVYPVADALPAGDEISSTYEGRHVTFLASELTHAGALVTKGLPVVCGKIVGIPFKTEVLGTDLIAVDTEGIWIVDVFAQNDAGVSAVAGGDELFINSTTCVVSKISAVGTQVPFGYALGIVGAGLTETIAVKLHAGDVEIPEITYLTSQELDHAAFTDNAGTATGFIDFTSGTLPVGAIPLGWKAVTSEGFAGDVSATVQVGVTGDVDRFTADVSGSCFTAITVGSAALAVDAAKGIAAVATPRVTVTTNADFTSVSAGKMVVTVYYIAG